MAVYAMSCVHAIFINASYLTTGAQRCPCVTFVLLLLTQISCRCKSTQHPRIIAKLMICVRYVCLVVAASVAGGGGGR